MPIYEYQCGSCGRLEEVLQKMSDAPLSACPECGGSVSKLMSMNSFHLKGSGWYVTDYARKNGPGGSTAKTDKSSAAAPAAEKKTETKTESACTGGETV